MRKLAQWLENYPLMRQSMEHFNTVAIVPLVYIMGVGLSEGLLGVVVVGGLGVGAWLRWTELWKEDTRKRKMY